MNFNINTFIIYISDKSYINIFINGTLIILVLNETIFDIFNYDMGNTLSKGS